MDLSKLLPWSSFWRDAFKNPEAAFEAESGKGNLKDGLLVVALVSAGYAVLAGIGIFLVLFFLSAMMPKSTYGDGYPGPIGYAGQIDPYSGFMSFMTGMLVFIVLAIPVFIFLSFLLFAIVSHFAAKLLGGSGNFGNHVYLTSLVMPIAMGLSVPASSASGIVACLGAIVGIAFVVYIAYLLSAAVKAAHKLSWSKAVISVVTGGIAYFLLNLIAIFLFIGFVTAMAVR